MSLDWWQALGIVCGALIAAATVLRMAVKGTRRMWRLMRKASAFLDQVLGDKQEGRPSMMELLEDNRRRLEKIEAAQAEHLEQWHGGGKSEGPVPLRGRRQR